MIDQERQLAFDIAERIRARTSGSAAATYTNYQRTIPHTTVSYSMVAIPAGDFCMGSSAASDSRCRPDETPQRPVHIDAFWMQAHTVTWDEYQLFMFARGQGLNDGEARVDAISRPTKPYVDMSFGMGVNGYPAISMTQHAANKYAQWLSAKTGEFYRLPTEAEWEYACRAGTTTPYFFGSDRSLLGEYAWFADNSGGQYQKVATKKPNAWGLFDMLGNVMEWTLDQYAPYSTDGHAPHWVKPATPYPLTARGGSWADVAEDLRCAARVPSDPSWKRQDPGLPKSIWYETDAPWLGFRLIRPQTLPSNEEMFGYWNNGVEYDEM